METIRPIVLSIAGFDPCGGAGILADCKVFEMHRVQGMSVCTSITIQNDHQFEGLSWIPLPTLLKQLDILFTSYPIQFVKIGLVEHMQRLNEVVDRIHSHNPTCTIIWDPILKASAGFTFHESISQTLLIQVLKKIDLVTPNIPETLQLVPSQMDALEGAKLLSQYCAVFLKGGHSESEYSEDFLYERNVIHSFKFPKILKGEKHGSGCILSSAITSNLSNGLDLKTACDKAIQYTRQVLASNSTLLGYHTLTTL